MRSSGCLAHLRQVRSHQDQRQEAKVKKRRDKNIILISNTSAGPGGRQDSRERGARSPASKHRHAAAAGPVPAALHTHARVWPLSADREHGAGPGKPWLHPVVPLEDGNIFLWPTGPGTDDWLFKHGVYWPRMADQPWYAGPPAGQRRIAFVFRCTRPSRYYQSAWPHRVVVPCV